MPHNFCILLVSKRINKTSTIQQDETNKQCLNTHSFINIEESFPTKSVKVIPATFGTAGITGLPYFIPSLTSLFLQVNRLCHPNSFILSAIFCFSSRGTMLLKRASGTSSSVRYQVCFLERVSSPALDITA